MNGSILKGLEIPLCKKTKYDPSVHLCMGNFRLELHIKNVIELISKGH